MKRFWIFFWLAALACLVSACQTSGGATIDTSTALGRVQSAMNAYQAGNGNSFEEQLSLTQRRSSTQCPGQQQYGCLKLAYQIFGENQQSTAQSPLSFNFIPYDRQTTPNVMMILVEGNWGGNPAVVSCQVFFVINDGSSWLIDNFDAPEAITCQERGEILTQNLFGPELTLTPANP
jgi:hypothetical protein